MKNKLVELGKELVVIVLAILIISLFLWVLGAIIVSIFALPITLTYLKCIGFTAILSTIRFIVNFLIKGFDVENILKESHKEDIADKRYKFKITYKNKTKQDGEIMACDIEQASDILLNSQCNVLNNGKSANYRNFNEVQFCEIEEIND